MSNLDVFDIFTRDYARERFETMSLRDWLLAARDDKMLYAAPAERMVAAIGEPELVRYGAGCAAGADILQPHDQALQSFRRLLRHGRHDRTCRQPFQARRARSRREAPDSLSPRSCRRRQISLAERLKDLMEKHPIYVLKAGENISPVFERPAGPLPLRRTVVAVGRQIRHRQAPYRSGDEPVGGEAAGRIRR